MPFVRSVFVPNCMTLSTRWQRAKRYKCGWVKRIKVNWAHRLYSWTWCEHLSRPAPSLMSTALAQLSCEWNQNTDLDLRTCSPSSMWSVPATSYLTAYSYCLTTAESTLFGDFRKYRQMFRWLWWGGGGVKKFACYIRIVS